MPCKCSAWTNLNPGATQWCQDRSTRGVWGQHPWNVPVKHRLFMVNVVPSLQMIAGVIWAKFGGNHLTSKVAISLKRYCSHVQDLPWIEATSSKVFVAGWGTGPLVAVDHKRESNHLISHKGHKLLGKSVAMPIYGIIWRFWNVMHAVALSLHNQALVIAHLMKCQHISLRSAWSEIIKLSLSFCSHSKFDRNPTANICSASVRSLLIFCAC